MRHIGLALGTLALILALGYANMVWMTRTLTEIDEALLTAQEAVSEETLARARTLWEAAGTRLYATAPHQAIEQVSGALARAAVYLGQGRVEETRVELTAARDGVRVLLTRERLTLGNVL